MRRLSLAAACMDLRDLPMLTKNNHLYLAREQNTSPKFLKGREKKAHEWFQHKLLAPTQNPEFLGKPLCASFPGKGCKKGDPHKLFQGEFWGRKGGPTQRGSFGQAISLRTSGTHWVGRPGSADIHEPKVLTSIIQVVPKHVD